jgi:hypothetical protein
MVREYRSKQSRPTDEMIEDIALTPGNFDGEAGPLNCMDAGLSV